jgi:hypothetical protein
MALVGISDTQFCPKITYRSELSGNTFDAYKITDLCSNFLNNQIPMCINTLFYEDGSGCCIAPEAESCKDRHSTGLKYIFKENNGEEKKYNVCHKKEIQKYIQPNKIKDFFSLVLQSILAILLTAIVGCCYEFWLRYGDSKDCIYYKSRCNNIGKSDEVSLIDYMFPNSVSYYPYQLCEKSSAGLSGGKKVMRGGNIDTIKSNYPENYQSKAKCVTIDPGGDSDIRKQFPYNIGDTAEKTFDNELFKMPFKSFSLFFLYSILILRMFINYGLKLLSNKYQKHVSKNVILSNLVFLLLTGIVFPIIALYTGISGLHSGPSLWIGLLCGLASIILNFTPILAVLFSISFMTKSMFRFVYDDLDKHNLELKDYSIFNTSPFYSWKEGGNYYEILLKNSLVVIKNFLIGMAYFIMVIISLMSGILSHILLILYFNISLIWNIFYIPLSNPMEFLDILKDHGEMLTILLCISVIGASAETLNYTTTGIMGGLLALITLFKLSKNLKKTI